MGKALIILIGLIFIALGVWGIVAWGAAVLIAIKAMVALGFVVVGLGMLAFGISEIRSAAEERRLAAEAEATPPPVPPAQPESSDSEGSS
ncbi:MAG: hypothetical protein JSV65_12735 [Armatimonadota bacterium]|nr:MAG: hypothetical protein JSV65_12735 [Armatimonadota bacterium]